MGEVYWEKITLSNTYYEWDIVLHSLCILLLTYKITLWSNFYYSHFIDREMRLTDQGKLNPLLKEI